MNKQYSTLVLALLLAAANCCSAQSAHLSSHPVQLSPHSQLMYLECTDSLNVWALAGPVPYDTNAATLALNMEVARSADGGIHWTTYPIPGTSINDSAMLSNFWPVNGTTAYVAFYELLPGTGGYIKRTTDGGSSWQDVTVGGNNFVGGFLNFVYFFNADTGIAVGDPQGGYFEIYQTTNGGSSWTRIPQGSIPAPQANEYGNTNVFSFSDGHFHFNTTTGRIIYTTNRGTTWQVAAGTIPPYAGQANPSGRIIGNGEMIYDTYNNNHTYYYTTDLGVTYTTKTYPVPGYISTASPISPRTGNTLMTTAYRITAGVFDSMYIYQCNGSAATTANWQRTLAVSSYDYAFGFNTSGMHASFYSPHLGWLIGAYSYELGNGHAGQVVHRFDDCTPTPVTFNAPDTVCNNAVLPLSGYASPAGGMFYPYIYFNEITDFIPADYFPLIAEQDSVFNLQYQYVNGSGCYSDAFDIVYVEECPPTGISEAAANTFAVYPNPATSELMLPLLREGEQAHIYDLAGKELPMLLQGTTLNIETLPAGMYVLQLSSTQYPTRQARFVKQ